jgi:UDP-N-acetylglucosamine 3-dehydrogenase
MSSQLTALVVGCGRIGSGYDLQRHHGFPLTHAGAYAEHPKIAFVGGVDIDAAARARFERRWGVKAYADLDEALECSPDLVSLATPPTGRGELVERLVKADPQAIWIEKPLAATAAEGQVIVEGCRKAGIGLQVNFVRRFDPLHQRLVQTVHADGAPVHADFRFSGTFENFGSHALDLFRWLAGDPTRVEAMRLRNGQPMAILTTRDGSSASMLRVRVGAVTVFDVDILTARRRVTIAASGEQAGESVAGASRHFPEVQLCGLPLAVDSEDAVEPMTAAADSLVRHVDHGEQLPCDGQDGLAALRLHEAILAAACAPKAVELAA